MEAPTDKKAIKKKRFAIESLFILLQTSAKLLWEFQKYGPATIS